MKAIRQAKLPRRELSGWINLDKPYDMTSTQAVGAVKRLLRPQKIGHAGTLDPLATGILPLALGEATKTVQYLVDTQKTYIFTVFFGRATTTCDTEGEVIETSDILPSAEQIRAALPHFTGVIEQVPPAFSAIKVGGKRAYDLARAGEVVELESREIRIDSLELVDMLDAQHAVIKAECGKGTYVRALARDMAEFLGSCGHVSALRRTAVGSFNEENSITLQDIEDAVQDNSLDLRHQITTLLQPVSLALDDILAVHVDEQLASQLRQGRSIRVSRTAIESCDVDVGDQGIPEAGNQKVLKAVFKRQLIALVEPKGTLMKPVRVFNF